MNECTAPLSPCIKGTPYDDENTVHHNHCEIWYKFVYRKKAGCRHLKQLRLTSLIWCRGTVIVKLTARVFSISLALVSSCRRDPHAIAAGRILKICFHHDRLSIRTSQRAEMLTTLHAIKLIDCLLEKTVSWKQTISGSALIIQILIIICLLYTSPSPRD